MLHDKVALVTGAATGLGEAIARHAFEAGARLVVAGHDPESLSTLVRDLDPGGERSRALEVDVRDLPGMQRVVAFTVETFGSLHLAVNNVGLPGPSGKTLPEVSLDEWDTVLSTNLTGTFVSMKAEIPAILNSGGGSVVNLSSANGVVGVPRLSAYTAAKHGIIGLTRSAALEFADKNIRINAIGPGYVGTQRMQQSPPEVLEWMAGTHPMNRLASPDEIAGFAVFLLSDKASFCTGAFYPIDGGYTAR